MFDLPDYLKFPFEIQQKFEIALIKDEYNKIDNINPSFLISEFGLSQEHSQVILNCAYRKGLLKKLSTDEFSREKPAEPKITSVFQHAEKIGQKPMSIVRSVDLVSASKPVSEKLKIDEGDPLYQQKRSRLIDDHVIANQCNSIPYCVTPDLHTLDLRKRSFQVVLENRYHAVVHSIDEDYKITDPTEEDREILDLSGNEKIVSIQRLSLSASSQPLVYADIHVNPKQFHLVEKLWPEAAELLNSSRQ